MDNNPPAALELSAASRWGSCASPHELAEALSLLLARFPLDARARAACVCRAWRVAAAHPNLWAELSFKGCTAHCDNATLASLCARAGAALHTLRLDADACSRVTAAGMVAALRKGGFTGVRRLTAPPLQENEDLVSTDSPKRLTAELARQLAAAYPKLQHAACSVRCSLSDAAEAATTLPGPLTLDCRGFSSEEAADATQLAQCLH
jgi:hypothetical protein